MGELKDVAESQVEVKLVDRVKDLGNQVSLASLGVVSKVEEVVAKVEEEGQKQLDKLVAAGQAARGEQAANDKKVVLVAVGLVETLKVEADKLKVEAEKLFNDLVAAGEKRKAA
ncbi:MAG TPA: hypothetical protein PKL69_10570 [Agitococcus sp.]|uniref:hypothetical protein n=1 Tax=uncultured Agitococcus sp. TaxID=1506599 RepID=UPI002636C0C3|nr:hypothetical protein [uncultured Agitococcus sp.]HMU88128.1 hypothetical protein [Agitococcus sp.]HMV60316.1 hypothetical protein [Agitococcus sp.]HMX99254.1 hypothetical protein [Agitococcus sp.]HMY28417.1 hypothetical protein [Agitococcus sp.]HMY82027.1 hypothetical protein [Agitococcus sp.]